jgi:hypothetical protein
MNAAVVLRVLVTIGLCALALASSAGVYQWTDENGKVHFSDKPPADARNKAKEVKARGATSRSTSSGRTGTGKSIPNVAMRQGIAAVGETRAVKLEKIVFQPEEDASGRSGMIYSGARCDRRTTAITRSTQRTALRSPEFTKQFTKVLRDYGYAVSDDSDVLFSGQKSASAELRVAAVITDIDLEGCQPNRRKTRTRIKSYMKVEWKMFDSNAREIIYEGMSEGVSEGEFTGKVKTQLARARTASFKAATNNLLADAKFVAHLSGVRRAVAARRESAHLPMNLDLHFGAPGRVFVDVVEQLNLATVTVRASGGHGTGFVVDSAG